MAKFQDVQAPYTTFLESAAPSTPASGLGFVYEKTDGKLYFKNDAGTEYDLTALGSGGFGAYSSSWTPALTAVTTNPTLGTGSITEGRYAEGNKTVVGHAYVKFGTSGVAAGSGEYRISLPVNADTGMTSRIIGSGVIYDSSAGDLRTVALSLVNATTAKILFTGTNPIVSNSIPWTWNTSDELNFILKYQAA